MYRVDVVGSVGREGRFRLTRRGPAVLSFRIRSEERGIAMEWCGVEAWGELAERWSYGIKRRAVLRVQGVLDTRRGPGRVQETYIRAERIAWEFERDLGFWIEEPVAAFEERMWVMEEGWERDCEMWERASAEERLELMGPPVTLSVVHEPLLKVVATPLEPRCTTVGR